MFDITMNLTALDFATVFACLLGLQFILAIYLIASLRIASRERHQLNKEMFGLLKKIDGLTSAQREQMVKHYDHILEDLSARLPASVAAQAGEMIFQTESQLLARLAELEPQIGEDEAAKERMDKLIRSMENLETRIVSITAEAVQRVMTDSRRDLFRDDFDWRYQSKGVSLNS